MFGIFRLAVGYSSFQHNSQDKYTGMHSRQTGRAISHLRSRSTFNFCCCCCWSAAGVTAANTASASVVGLSWPDIQLSTLSTRPAG